MSTIESPFVRRGVPLGSGNSLAVDMAVLEHPGQTLVVLREAQDLDQPRAQVLGTYFTHIATSLRTELVLLKQAREPLRFFHLLYEANADPRQPARWVLKEVKMALASGLYTLARWQKVEATFQDELSEALSLLEPPKRTCL